MKSSWCWNEQACHGVKCKVRQLDQIPLCIRTYLLHILDPVKIIWKKMAKVAWFHVLFLRLNSQFCKFPDLTNKINSFDDFSKITLECQIIV